MKANKVQVQFHANLEAVTDLEAKLEEAKAREKAMELRLLEATEGAEEAAQAALAAADRKVADMQLALLEARHHAINVEVERNSASVQAEEATAELEELRKQQQAQRDLTRRQSEDDQQAQEIFQALWQNQRREMQTAVSVHDTVRRLLRDRGSEAKQRLQGLLLGSPPAAGAPQDGLVADTVRFVDTLLGELEEAAAQEEPGPFDNEGEDEGLSAESEDEAAQAQKLDASKDG